MMLGQTQSCPTPADVLYPKGCPSGFTLQEISGLSETMAPVLVNGQPTGQCQAVPASSL